MTSFINWDDSWTFCEVSSVDVDGTAINDNASLTTDEISLDGYAGIEIGIAAVEDNTGAVDGEVYVHILGYGATGWQTIDDEPGLPLAIPVAQNATRRGRISIAATEFSSLKLLIDNDCGQQVTVSAKYKRCTVDNS